MKCVFFFYTCVPLS